MTKGLIFSISLLLIAIGALTSAVFIVTRLSDQVSDHSDIGRKSLLLNLVNVEKETLLFQVDQMARHNLFDVVEVLAASGGIGDDSCGIVDGVVVWSTVNKKCYRTKTIDETLGEIFKEAFQEDLVAKQLDQRISMQDYEIFIEPNPLTIHGVASRPVEIPIIQDQESKGSIVIRPSFEAKMQYDLRIYDELYVLADRLNDDCSNKPTAEETQQCVRSRMPQTMRIEFSARPDQSNVYVFTATHSYEPPLSSGTRDLVIKFGLTLPSLAPAPVLSAPGTSTTRTPLALTTFHEDLRPGDIVTENPRLGIPGAGVKTVASIEISGERVIVHYTDGSEVTADSRRIPINEDNYIIEAFRTASP